MSKRDAHAVGARREGVQGGDDSLVLDWPVVALRADKLPRHPAVGALARVGDDRLLVHGERLHLDRAAVGQPGEPGQPRRVGVAVPLAWPAMDI